jgi:stage II sporulation protein R
MKRKAIILSIMVLVVLMVNMKFQTATTHAATNDIKIPKEAIRLRILANSNSAHDQQVKREVRDAVIADVTGWVGDLKTIAQARRVIRDHLPAIRKTVAKTLNSYHADPTFKVKFGDIQFPTKIYGNYVYPAGTYEGLLVTLGKGSGANWWCVLFPPLCFLDFENGDAVKPASSDHSAQVQTQPQDDSDIHVKFFFVDWITSLFDHIVHFITSLFG